MSRTHTFSTTEATPERSKRKTGTPEGITEIIAIVEAKRSSFDPRLAQAQTEFYVKEIEKRQGWRPFAFMTNGYETFFLDVGIANKRLVAPRYHEIISIRNDRSQNTGNHKS